MDYSFLLDIGIILVFVKLFGLITNKFNMPKMLGGLIAGIVLGPAILNVINLTPSLEFLESIGFIFIIFLVGIETRLKSLVKGTKKYIVIALGGIIVPLVMGFFASMLYTVEISLNVFFGIILTVTSVGLTAEYLMETKKLNTSVGNAILGAGVIDDVIGIMCLSFIMNPSLNVATFGIILLKTILFFVIAFASALIMFKVFEWLEKKMSHQEELPILSIAFALILSYVAEMFGISGIIGAYIAGLVVGRTTEGRYIRNKIEVLVHMLFAPIAYAGIGLKLTTLLFPFETWLVILLFTVVAILSKVIGCGLGAKLCKYKTKNALRIGVGMVTRGDIAFIMLHEAKNAAIINEEIFVIMLITLCFATFISPTLLHMFFKEDEEVKEEKKIEA